ncbi:unnamed protein product [Dibothriocephalus latus]|uniref:Cadherin domain-containing protein n=1 Tax=Dibothriocephalus latus TaxID=60516 RepID=A0A3P7LVT3_DIBLA|nr:unnamed protein product [Dibothriocephalus latus]
MVNSTTGTITVGARGLDREQREAFELLIEVVDGKPTPSAGSAASSPVANLRHNSVRLTTQTTVQINVLDENDNAPTFIFPKNGLVSLPSSNICPVMLMVVAVVLKITYHKKLQGTVTLTCTDILTLPKVVIQVVANDSDKGLNAEIEYSVNFNKDGDPASAIQIPTDDKKASSPLPHRQEATATPKGREYDLPWFDIEPRSGEVSLVAADGLSLRCQALRQDQMLVNRELGKYTLLVTAKDKGVPALSAVAQVYVRIITTDTDVTAMTVRTQLGPSIS